MPVIELRDPALRQQLGLWDGTDTVLERSQHRKPRQHHRSRGEARFEIVYALTRAHEPLTRLQIAREIGRAKTPHFIALLEALVDEGVLRRHEDTWRGVIMYTYEVNE